MRRENQIIIESDLICHFALNALDMAVEPVELVD